MKENTTGVGRMDSVIFGGGAENPHSVGGRWSFDDVSSFPSSSTL